MGIMTALGIVSKTITQPAPLLPLSVVSLIGMVLVITGIYISIRESRFADPVTFHQRLAPAFVLANFFAFIIFGWGYSK
jgi:uncharacterized membrane protein